MPYDIMTAGAGYLDVLAGADPDLAELLGASSGQALQVLAGAHPAALAHAARQGHPAARAALQRLVAERIADRGTIVSEQPFRAGREWVIGFDPVTLPARVAPALLGASVLVVTQPQVVFRGERLIIPSDIGGGVQIIDVKVGNRSQLAAGASLPGRTFDERGVGVRLQMDTAQISQQIIIIAANTTGADITFTASIIGRAVAM
jgi:hypothetical protein